MALKTEDAERNWVMGLNQPEKAAAVSVQQLSRQAQVMVTEALRTLDKARAINPAGQGEVDSLRSVVWSDLTGLEAEFTRLEGPRAEVLERFFNHLLSNGGYAGEIESLAEALLGGAPPPAQPPPDSPVAGLFRLHSALTDLRRQWQEAAPSQAARWAPAAPPPLRREAAPAVPVPPVKQGSVPAQADFFEEMGLPPSKQEMRAPPVGRRRASADRPTGSQPKRPITPDRLLGSLGLRSPGASTYGADVETGRPRVLVSFVTVFIILALMGVGVIYLGLNNNSQAAGIVPSVVPTFSITIPATTPQPTPTLSSADPQLSVTGNPLIVPCPNQGTSGFVLRNTGGQRLNWSAIVDPVGTDAQPVTLSATSGSLYGPQNSGTDAVTVTVTAKVGNIDGTITVSSNASDPVEIVYHIHGC